MKLNAREHEMADEPRMRVWTDDMEPYGQFIVVDPEDYHELKRIYEKYKWTLVEHFD